MNKLLQFSLFCLFFSAFGFTQTEQTDAAAKKSLLKQQYNIYDSDHRGLVIYYNDQASISYPIQQTFNSLNEAFVFFFGGGIMKDMVVVAVNQPQTLYPQYVGGSVLDMNQSIEKYIEIFNQ